MPGSYIFPDCDIQEVFLAAPPTVQEQILNLSVKQPEFMRDVYELKEWPDVPGNELVQLITRGRMPTIERGFDKWARQPNNTGCDPCSGVNCAYNWTDLGGNGFERKATTLGHREFRSPSYCIDEISSTLMFQEVFAQIVANLYAQIAFFKAVNIGQNGLTSLSKKYVVDSDGAKPNRQNPYVYPNIGTVKLSTLNITMLEFFYEFMRRSTNTWPYDVVDGSPIFAIEASHQLLARLYLDDPNLRQDVHFSGLANDMLLKYNFMSTIRGMFIAAPILYPRRFRISGGEPIEVLPWVNDVPMEVGSFTGNNPLYEDPSYATHEEIILHGKYPFSVYFKQKKTTLGANTSFGPEPSFFNTWDWVNPQTVEDPYRRVGYFVTAASIGISQQWSDGMYAILVARPQTKLMATFLPDPACPPTPSDCDNSIPAQGCPCPLVLNFSANPITAGDYFISLAVPTDALAEDEVQFGLDTGGYVNGTVVAVSADAKTLEVTFPAGTNLGDCDHFTTLFCDDTLGCSADVVNFSVVCTDATQLTLTLSNNIKAVTAADVVTIYFGNCTSASATVVSVDMTRNVWVVDVGGTAFCDNVGGVVGICVPPATDASCSACGSAPSSTQCST